MKTPGRPNSEYRKAQPEGTPVDAAVQPGHAAGAPAALVACLCAAWCTTCTAYRATLAAVAAARPDLRFAWIDIEDDADTLGDDSLDIDTFPTVMVLRQGRVLFYGALLPQAANLARLLASLDEATDPASGAAPLADAPAALAAAVWQLGPLRPLPGATA